MEIDELRAVAAAVDAVEGFTPDSAARLEGAGGEVRLLIRDSAQAADLIAEISAGPAQDVAGHAEAEALRLVREPLSTRGYALPETVAEVPTTAGALGAPGDPDAEFRMRLRRPLPGRPISREHLQGEDGLVRSLARAVATIHSLPTYPAEAAGLPVYDAETCRARHIDDLDRAAQTGVVPPSLLSRWEHDLEDVRLWRFLPQLVHGNFSERAVLVEDDQVTALLRWEELRVGDPAQDLLWVVTTLEAEQAEAFYSDYQAALPGTDTAELRLRAELLAELDLIAWLLHGVDTDDQEIVDDARALLEELAAVLTEDHEPLAQADSGDDAAPETHVHADDDDAPPEDSAGGEAAPGAHVSVQEDDGPAGDVPADDSSNEDPWPDVDDAAGVVDGAGGARAAGSPDTGADSRTHEVGAGTGSTGPGAGAQGPEDGTSDEDRSPQRSEDGPRDF